MIISALGFIITHSYVEPLSKRKKNACIKALVGAFKGGGE